MVAWLGCRLAGVAGLSADRNDFSSDELHSRRRIESDCQCAVLGGRSVVVDSPVLSLIGLECGAGCLHSHSFGLCYNEQVHITSPVADEWQPMIHRIRLWYHPASNGGAGAWLTTFASSRPEFAPGDNQRQSNSPSAEAIFGHSPIANGVFRAFRASLFFVFARSCSLGQLF